VLIGWASIPKVVASIHTVARHIFQACPVLLIIDIIDTPLKGLFSDKNYKHINLLYYYYI
jgi:hypothetical protein